MDAAQFAKMFSDKHLFEINRMEYKYTSAAVKEFTKLLRQDFAQELPLQDSRGEMLVYLPNVARISTAGMKQLLTVPAARSVFGLQAMTDEIHATLQIENIRSTRKSIRRILDGYAPRDEEENRIYGIKRGLEFIANRENKITEANLHTLYQMTVGNFLSDDDKLQADCFYRHAPVYIVGGDQTREGLAASLLSEAMAQLINFANQRDNINELHKAAMLHFTLAYYHPYFDGNGRTARLFHMWYLVQHGYPATLFTPFSRYIAENKSGYYKAYEQIEKNALLTGYTDVTPFLAYFCENVYGRLQSDTEGTHADMQVYRNAIASGSVTEKERQLWEYVLSAYGNEEFTTKRLERDFGNAAYATIRTFVMKFSSMNLLKTRKAGNKVLYKVF